MSEAVRPWQPGAVTGLGSLPGTDPAEAARLVVGELPLLPHLPELPARGPGADVIGRGAALLVDLPVEIVPTGWRLAAHAGRDLRRARDYLAWDLDALEQAAAGHVGPVKVQAAGPWTLAANLELSTGHPVVSDHGAVRDLVESLTEGLRLQLADLARRLPGVTPVLQLDEPSLSSVLAGAVPTPSGYGTVRAVPASVAQEHLRAVLELAPAGARVVHSCAPEVPIALLRSAGADAVALDVSLLRRAQYDALGEAVDAGTALWLGVVPTTGTPSFDHARSTMLRLWDELGFDRAQLLGAVVPTPACGLAGSSTAHARAVLRVLRDLGSAVLDLAG